MTRTPATTLEWVAEGTALCGKAIRGLDEAGLAEPSLLPGWSRKHVVAHLASNADAIGNLVHWARTGVQTPMYSSPAQRAEAIENGAALPPERLLAWFDDSARILAESMAELTGEQWRAEVVTAQGRRVPALETPWMRSREVMVHAVDLATGIRFTDLPEPFLEALGAEIRDKRGEAGLPEVHGSLPEITAYLAGRPYTGVTTSDGAPAAPLPPWL
ncbi:maleylpyruvate isomerase family mycothiol-dependent enzyme [Amycolatopsis taiwanensis]|uniref:maleylpyruvate isomerase family mycothiol-dependent enzyme n=1 Tax=Amycolatopsis taiwanensis TaxID=342230 RepID=UPI0004BB2EAF|nr:maleylpyruvate isomerase family mycothiol-dependent enzyme [Amycolatopsis taiwanensis]